MELMDRATSKNKFISLIANKGKNFNIPQNLQSLAIQDFAVKKNFKIIYNVIRQAKDGEFLYFEQRILEGHDIEGFIAYSFETLGNIYMARSVINMMLESKYKLWFVVEDFVLKDKQDMSIIENSYVIKKISENNAKNFEKIYSLIP